MVKPFPDLSGLGQFIAAFGAADPGSNPGGTIFSCICFCKSVFIEAGSYSEGMTANVDGVKMHDEMVAPVGVVLVGAMTVVLFYWVHRAVLGIGLMSANSVEVTLFLAAFLSQYIPLKIAEDRVRT